MTSKRTIACAGGVVGAVLGTTLVAALAAGCKNEDCTRTLTCPPPPDADGGGGSGAAGGAGGAGTGGNTALADGEPCDDPAACASGLCTDGVCCASTCDGGCETCAAPGDEGTCTAYAAGDDPESACGETGACNGEGLCGATHIWSQAFTASGFGVVLDVGTDDNGNVVILGLFGGSLKPGGADLFSDSNEAFVAKFDADGNHLWSEQFFGSGFNSPAGLAVSGAGDIFVTGGFFGTLNVRGTTLTAGPNGSAYIARLTPDGDHAYSRSLPIDSWGRDVVLAQGEDVVLAGEYNGAGNVGGAPLPTASVDSPFLARYSSTLTHRWSKGFPPSSANFSPDVQVTVGPGDSITMAAEVAGMLSFGGPTVNAGGGGVGIARFSSAGTHQWSTAFAGPDVGEVAVDTAGNVAMHGRLRDVTNFGGGIFTPDSGGDGYTVKLDAQGGHLWSLHHSGMGFGIGRAAHALPDGSTLVAGTFSGDFALPPHTFAANGANDAYLARYDAGGTAIWVHVYGDAGHQGLHHAALGPDGNVVMTGHVGSSIDLGGRPLMAPGSGETFFIAKLTP